MTTKACKICDFGFSKENAVGKARHTVSVGTPFWVAPEIINGEPYSSSCDVYSFGIILWELYTRRIPYDDREEPNQASFIRAANDPK